MVVAGAAQTCVSLTSCNALRQAPIPSSVVCPLRAAAPARVAQRVSRQSNAIVCQSAAAVEAATLPESRLQRPALADKYAVIDVGGTQHLVEEGRWYTCNRLQAEPGSKIQFGRVLALKADGEFHVGRPYLPNVMVEAEIIEELKGPKVTIYKMKPKKHYRRTAGHRQPLTKFRVTKIDRS